MKTWYFISLRMFRKIAAFSMFFGFHQPNNRLKMATRDKLLTQKLLNEGYQYHKLRKTFSKFYRRYYGLISKFQVGLKSLLCQGLSEPGFYGDFV